MDTDIFEPFEKLVEIEICGAKREVPENNTLLRCFQYLSMETISYGDFCWNGDCANCLVSFYEAGETRPHARSALACRTTVCEGMVITKTSLYLRRVGIPPSDTDFNGDVTNDDTDDGGNER